MLKKWMWLYPLHRKIKSQLTTLIPALIKLKIINAKQHIPSEYDNKKLCGWDFGNYTIEIHLNKNYMQTYVKVKPYGQDRDYTYEELILQQLQLRATKSSDGMLHIINTDDIRKSQSTMEEMAEKICVEIISSLMQLIALFNKTQDERMRISNAFSKLDQQMIVPFLEDLDHNK